jgi:hypothetical protein
MKVMLKDVGNHDLWSVDIGPRPDARPVRSWRSISSCFATS